MKKMLAEAWDKAKEMPDEDVPAEFRNGGGEWPDLEKYAK
jgi:hypothetical protein